MKEISCCFYSLHAIVHLLLMDNSQEFLKSKHNACRTKNFSAGLRTYKKLKNLLKMGSFLCTKGVRLI